MVNQSAFASSDSLVSGYESPMDAAADLWALVQVADMSPVTPETRERLSGARAALQQQLDLLGWDEAVLATWIRQNPDRKRPPDLGTGPRLCI